jgi:hypothetical protein
MILFLYSLFVTVDPQSFKHFKKSGHEAYCLVDYQKKTVSCEYKTLPECRDQYDTHKSSICFTKKSLKLEGDIQ